MWSRERRAVAAALAVVFAILLPAAITSAWIRGTILSTSGYVAAVTPVAANPEVRAQVEAAVTSKVDAALSNGGPAVSPIARVLAGLARGAVDRFMTSQAFQHLWADANRVVHSQVISILNGDSTIVTATGGEVVLDLPLLVNDVLHAVSDQLSAIAGHAVSLPPLPAIPAAACHAIKPAASSATGTASSGCTQIPLFPAAALAGPRHYYRILVATTTLLPVLTLLALAGAVAASPRRDRTLLQLAIGGTLTVLAVMIALSWGQTSLIDRAPPHSQAITGAFVHALTAGFFTMATWCVVAGGFAVTAVALLSSPAACRMYRRYLPGAYRPGAYRPSARLGQD